MVQGITTQHERDSMNATHTWAIGDHYFQADGTLHGRPWDIDAQPRLTEAEAESDARNWKFWLSDREKGSAETWVREYVIDGLQEDGQIGSAHSV